VPGLNCAIPEGASYGTHPGGWGKPPVDEHGNPLYGNPFAPPVPAGERPSLAAGAVDATPWGELDSESEAESDDDDDVGGGALAQDVDDDAVSRGISSVASLDPGTDTPHALQLRKERPTGTDTPTSTHGGADGGADIAPRALYQVLEERKAEVGSAAFGSAHTYALAPALAAEPARLKKGGGGGGGAGSVELALDPSELEDLDEETLKRKYDAQLSAHKRATAKEDFSDLVHEHEARKRRKVCACRSRAPAPRPAPRAGARSRRAQPRCAHAPSRAVRPQATQK
jgi:splicing factor 3B subunit 2